MTISDHIGLRDLYEYNAWANTRVISVCAGQDGSALEERAPGTQRLLQSIPWQHLVDHADAQKIVPLGW